MPLPLVTALVRALFRAAIKPENKRALSEPKNSDPKKKMAAKAGAQ
jgi:hypothetical protein